MLTISLLDKVDYPEKPQVLQIADSVLFFARASLGYEDITFKKIQGNSEKEKIQVERVQKVKGAFARVLCFVAAFILAIPSLIALAIKWCTKGSQDKYIQEIEILRAKRFLPSLPPKTPVEIPPSFSKRADEEKLIEISVKTPPTSPVFPKRALPTVPALTKDALPEKNKTTTTIPPTPVVMTRTPPVVPNIELPKPIAKIQEAPTPPMPIGILKTTKAAAISATPIVPPSDDKETPKEPLTPSLKKVKTVRLNLNALPLAHKSEKEKKKSTLRNVTPIDIQVMELEQLAKALDDQNIDDILSTFEALSSFIPNLREIDQEKFREEFTKDKAAFCSDCRKEINVVQMKKDLLSLRAFAKAVLNTKEYTPVEIIKLYNKLSTYAKSHIAERICFQQKEVGYDCQLTQNIFFENENLLDPSQLPQELEAPYKEKEVQLLNPRYPSMIAVCKELLAKGIVLEPDSEEEQFPVEEIDSVEYLKSLAGR